MISAGYRLTHQDEYFGRSILGEMTIVGPNGLKSHNSALADFQNAEALNTEIITETGSYTLDKSISDYKLVEIIMQYGTTNWTTTRLFRSSTLSQFPNIMDSAKTSMLECYYNIYINGKSLNVGAISSNTRILIRGIN